jgi:hypothetical protein
LSARPHVSGSEYCAEHRLLIERSCWSNNFLTLPKTLTASLTDQGYRLRDHAAATGGTRAALYRCHAADRLEARWKLELSYTYRRREVDGFSDPAMSNATMFMLTYYPPKLAFSN